MMDDGRGEERKIKNGGEGETFFFNAVLEGGDHEVG